MRPHGKVPAAPAAPLLDDAVGAEVIKVEPPCGDPARRWGLADASVNGDGLLFRAEAHWWERGCFKRVTDPIYGELLLQMPAWRMTRTPPRLKWPCRPAGYHNGHVLQKYFGYGPRRLAELRREGIV